MRSINPNSPVYKDFYEWSMTQASLLKQRRFDELDIENIIYEIEELARNEKRTLRDILTVLLENMIMKQYNHYLSVKKTKHWDLIIFNTRMLIERLLEDSPSLTEDLDDLLVECYGLARSLAIIETDSQYTNECFFSELCPWTLKEVLGE